MEPLPAPPPTRRGSPHIKVWVLPSEKAAIEAKAAAHTLSASGYLRGLGLDMPLKSTLDQAAVLELARVNGELGRLGNLLKVFLARREPTGTEERFRALLASLEATQALLFARVESL